MTYSFLLLFGIRNTVKILIMQGKWRMYFLTTFYVGVFVVAINNIICKPATLLYFTNPSEKEHYEKLAMTTSAGAFYSSAVLGIFLIGTINELGIKLR